MAAVLLAQCSPSVDKRKNDEMAEVTIPPHPPHCKLSSNIEDVISNNEKIINVKIVKIGEKILYFPEDTMKENLADEFIDKGIPPSSRFTLSFDPYLSKNECPGVIHTIRNNEKYDIFPALYIHFDGSEKYRNVKSNGGIYVVSITQNLLKREKEFSRFRNLIHNSPYSYLVEYDDNILVIIKKPGQEKQLKAKSASIDKFLDWLSTPPARRDNNAVFSIEVDND